MDVEIKEALAELRTAAGTVAETKAKLDDFEKKHQSALAEMKARLDAEKAEREDLEIRMSRNGIGGGGSGSNAALVAETKALAAFARRGDEGELKALSVGSDPDGGFLVTPAMAGSIAAKLRETSPIAGLARRVTMGPGDAWEEPRENGEAGFAWVGETESRSVQASPTVEMLRIPLHEITTTVRITQRLLDDSAFDVGGWVEGRIGDRFARAEGAAFVTGSGVNRPRGFTTYATEAAGDSTRTAGKLEHVASGASGAFAASNPADKLVDLVTALRAPYRPRAAWLMSRTTAGLVRKFKDGQGRFLWSDSLVAGTPSMLLGHPVYLDEEMPEIVADSLSVAFGDFERGYTIIARPGMRLLRDPYTAKPNVDFYATKRTGGDVADFDAIKLLKFAAS